MIIGTFQNIIILQPAKTHSVYSKYCDIESQQLQCLPIPFLLPFFFGHISVLKFHTNKVQTRKTEQPPDLTSCTKEEEEEKYTYTAEM